MVLFPELCEINEFLGKNAIQSRKTCNLCLVPPPLPKIILIPSFLNSRIYNFPQKYFLNILKFNK